MEHSPQTGRIRQAVDASLAELGVPNLPCLGVRFLVEDGFYVGQRFLFEGLEADWSITQKRIDFFDEQGRLVKSVALDDAQVDRAA